jgi:hypothetical protein
MELFTCCKTGLRAAMFAALCVICAGRAAHAAESRTYTADLATLYNEYQRVLAVRDACITAQPAKRGDFSEAYQDWLNRHVRIVDDLDNRFAAIVKRASKDQADYSKNYGKYQSEVLQMREENKKALLANKEKLAQQCAELAAYLRHPKSDIPALFPAEFKSVYRVR